MPGGIGSGKSNNYYAQLPMTPNVYENVYRYPCPNIFRTCTVNPRRPVDGKFLVDPEHLRSVNIYEARTTTSTTAVARTPTSLYELDPFR